MANKKKNCLVFETLGKVTDLTVVEESAKNSNEGIRLHGIFGVCGIKNGNNRIYSKENYGKMVENLQNVIATEGCLGELEHPNTMNIDLNKVSHKIESIEMNEDGTITGTIQLLDTEKGRNAIAIIKAGGPLYISSRGAGSISEGGNVTLTQLKTYDLVGTPGFAQAKMNLKENQTLECLNESLAIIYESEDEGSEDDKDKKENEEPKDDDNKKDGEEKDKEKEENTEEPTEKPEEDNKDNNDNKVSMEDLKQAIDKLTEKVTTLEAELHVAQESLANNTVNYDAIEQWVNEEFAPEFMNKINEANENQIEKIAEGVENWANAEFKPDIKQWVATDFAGSLEKWITEHYTAEVERWINEEYSATLEQWINEQYSETIQNWITEEYSAKIEEWITEEYSAKVEQWINEEYSSRINDWMLEEFAPNVDKWINEEFANEYKESILNEAYNTVNGFLEKNKENRLDQIDKMLESFEAVDGNSEINKIVEESRKDMAFANVYVVKNMPAEYQPSWNTISEAKQMEIIRSSRMYDFTKEGVLEKFWASVNFDEAPINENQEKPLNENLDIASTYKMNIINRMKQLGNR